MCSFFLEIHRVTRRSPAGPVHVVDHPDKPTTVDLTFSLAPLDATLPLNPEDAAIVLFKQSPELPVAVRVIVHDVGRTRIRAFFFLEYPRIYCGALPLLIEMGAVSATRARRLVFAATTSTAF